MWSFFMRTALFGAAVRGELRLPVAGAHSQTVFDHSGSNGTLDSISMSLLYVNVLPAPDIGGGGLVNAHCAVPAIGGTYVYVFT